MQQIGKGSLKSVFIGFPESVMLSMANNYAIDTKSNVIEIATNELFDAIAYEYWKAKIENLIQQQQQQQQQQQYQKYQQQQQYQKYQQQQQQQQ